MTTNKGSIIAPRIFRIKKGNYKQKDSKFMDMYESGAHCAFNHLT